MEEGIYIFGGKDSSNSPTNNLYIIRLGSKPFRWTLVDTIGTRPSKRFGHCMHYIADSRKVVVYGGRNDDLYKAIGQSALQDIFLLNIRYFVWEKVRIQDGTSRPRYNFSSFLSGIKTT